MNRWLWTDSQRAGAGAAVGASVAVGVVGTMFGPLPTWLAVPGGIALVGGWACVGGLVALAIGDWWDRR